MPDKLYQECHAVISGCRAIFEDLLESGVVRVPLDIPKQATLHSVTEVESMAQPHPIEMSAEDALAAIQCELVDCQRCGLGHRRRQVVFGVGNPNARLVLIGEAPDAEEDAQGEPFAGEPGQLLDRILFAMKLSREEVYLCNVVKCHPSLEGDPQKEDFEICEPFLKRQLAAISPEVILALGPFASQLLLQSSEQLSKLRGHWQDYAGTPLMPTFHPATLLQNPAAKHQVWEDVKQVMHRLQDGEG
ncbi:uracil-DNA glycosylase [Geopsychrobacter electrodiphilus]|uniref:uracil-DNA glycosylase n=1 Tax=Geopsychrobacter electrodiphilus TaxID=225196 RepID=UPI0003795ED3|nr:uracil-DNA glycosylase [Geopsychrobacter electrodiphilus]